MKTTVASAGELHKHIRVVPGFPKPEVQFLDITPLLASPDLLKQTVQGLVSLLGSVSFDAFVGIESRGFILAAALAQNMGKGFLPCRKAGKLPPPVIAQSYDLEYGSATLEMQSQSLVPKVKKVVIVDDVLATGGTLTAAQQIAEKAGFEVVDLIVLINIAFLNKMNWKGRPVPALFTTT